MGKYYPAVVDTISAGFCFTVPDFNGLTVTVPTLNEGFAKVSASLRHWLDTTGKDAPAESSIDDVVRGSRQGALCVTYVELPDVNRTVKVNLTMDGDLVDRIDAVAKNRSRWLSEAAEEKLRADGAGTGKG